MIYLASPYTHEDPNIRLARFFAAQDATAALIASGKLVFSPIVYTHAIALKYNLPHTIDFWQSFCLGMLKKADMLFVLCLPDWQSSRGILTEIEFADMHNIHIKYLTEDLQYREV